MSSNSAEAVSEVLDALEKRCAKAGIPCESGDLPFSKFRLRLPCGSKTRELRFRDRHLAALEQSSFEKYMLVGDYSAVGCLSEGTIEASLGSQSGYPFRALANVEILGDNSATEEAHIRKLEFYKSVPEDLRVMVSPRSPGVPDGRPWRLRLAVAGRPTVVELSEASTDFAALFPDQAEYTTLKLSPVSLLTRTNALGILEDLANSLSFEFEVRYDQRVRLDRESQSGWGGYPPGVNVEADSRGNTLTSLRFTYPAEALRIYRHAKAATSSPLFQFLAFYQVLEYFFDLNLQNAAFASLKNELSDPSFNLNDRTHLLRLVNAAKVVNATVGEREQLATTIQASVTTDRLLEFIEACKTREFFSGKQVVHGVPALRFDDKAGDLRDQVATRIYQIRCRVVHAKSDSRQRFSFILPESDEIAHLSPDTQLLRFIAQRAIIANSSPL